MKSLVKLFLSIFVLFSFSSCSTKEDTEKWISVRDNRIPVYDKIIEVKIDPQVEIVSGIPFLVGRYLLLKDSNNFSYAIHVFDKNDFHFIKSILPKGHGPGEIFVISSSISPIEDSNEFFMLANNVQFFHINIDSALLVDKYEPEIVYKWGKKAKIYGSDYQFINDSIAITDIIEPTGKSGFRESIGRFNLNTGEIRKFDYTHPLTGDKKRIVVRASSEYNTCAELQMKRDLITLYDTNGNLKCNIYGPDWTGDASCHGKVFYHQACFVQDKLLATYVGKDFKECGLPDRIFVYDVQGNYLKTLDFEGHHFHSLQYDKSHNYLLLVTDDYELAYLPLEGLL